MTSARKINPLVLWAITLPLYLYAIFARSMLSIAAPNVIREYDLGSLQFAALLVVYLAIYAMLQVPIGRLLDQLGHAFVLVSGLIIITAGELLVGYSGSFIELLICRAVVSLGDSCIFISIMRVIATTLPKRINPALTQLTIIVGQLGGVLATFPLFLLLNSFSWLHTILITSGVGVLIGLPALLILARQMMVSSGTAPASRDRHRHGQGSNARLHRPSVALGFWIHFTFLAAPASLMLLWGFEYFHQVLGLKDDVAASLLTMMTVSSLIAGVILGLLYHKYRSVILCFLPFYAAFLAIGWFVPIVVPVNMTYAFVLSVVIGASFPTAMLGFEVVKVPQNSAVMGVAVGLVNTGGCSSAILWTLIIAVGFASGSWFPNLAALGKCCLAAPVVTLLVGGFMIRRHAGAQMSQQAQLGEAA